MITYAAYHHSSLALGILTVQGEGVVEESVLLALKVLLALLVSEVVLSLDVLLTLLVDTDTPEGRCSVGLGNPPSLLRMVGVMVGKA